MTFIKKHWGVLLAWILLAAAFVGFYFFKTHIEQNYFHKSFAFAIQDEPQREKNDEESLDDEIDLPEDGDESKEDTSENASSEDEGDDDNSTSQDDSEDENDPSEEEQAMASPSASTALGATPAPLAKIVMVLSTQGSDHEQMATQVSQLSDQITLAVPPYGEQQRYWSEFAAQKKRDFVQMLPMEPVNFPDSDPGPLTLLTGVANDENVQKASKVLDGSPECKGVINFMGSRFLASKNDLEPIVDVLKKKGLVFVENFQSDRAQGVKLCKSHNVPAASVSLVVDEEPSLEAIQQQLQQLEKKALDGKELAVGFASASYPITLKALQTWAAQLQMKKIQLVSLSNALKVSA